MFVDHMRGMLGREITPQEHTMLNHVTSQGMAKINCDLGRGTNLEQTMAQLLLVFSAAKQHREKLMKSVPDTAWEILSSMGRPPSTEELVFLRDQLACIPFGGLTWPIKMLMRAGQLKQSEVVEDLLEEMALTHHQNILLCDANRISALTGQATALCPLVATDPGAASAPNATTSCVLTETPLPPPTSEETSSCSCDTSSAVTAESSSSFSNSVSGIAVADESTSLTKRRQSHLVISPTLTWFKDFVDDDADDAEAIPFQQFQQRQRQQHRRESVLESVPSIVSSASGSISTVGPSSRTSQSTDSIASMQSNATTPTTGATTSTPFSIPTPLAPLTPSLLSTQAASRSGAASSPTVLVATSEVEDTVMVMGRSHRQSTSRVVRFSEQLVEVLDDSPPKSSSRRGSGKWSSFDAKEEGSPSTLASRVVSKLSSVRATLLQAFSPSPQRTKRSPTRQQQQLATTTSPPSQLTGLA